MLQWIRRTLGSIAPQDVFEWIDVRNAAIFGGAPKPTSRVLGELKHHSGTLTLGDPQNPTELEITNVPAGVARITATVLKYPRRFEVVSAITVQLGDSTEAGSSRTIGEVGIDSGKLIPSDKSDLLNHWAEVDPERRGVILTPRDDRVLRRLKRLFQLKTVQKNAIRHEVIGPVSMELEQAIEQDLLADPTTAALPFLHFRVETDNTFERVNYLERPWGFLPIGNTPQPLMFVCDTGRGDGCYDVQATFVDEIPHSVTIKFVD